jgi:glycosyltransferase involved in cell wall biosynthesis
MSNSKQTILIDVRKLRDSGIGTYITNLVPRVIESLPAASFRLLGDTSDKMMRQWSGLQNAELIDCRVKPFAVNEQWELWRKTPTDVDLFWSPFFNIPLWFRGKLLVTVHDLFHLAMPKLAGGRAKQAYAQFMYAGIRRQSSKVLCVSQFTATELIRLTRIEPQKIAVTHLGSGNTGFARTDKSPQPKPYVLFVGNVKPHKNLKTLLRAFKLLQNDLPHDLVIVGAQEGFVRGDRDSVTAAVDFGGRVKLTGFVDDENLSAYYAHASLLVLPSLYEGFGLPPLEAMAIGCPVVAARAGALPEVCGDAALYFDPLNPDELATVIRRGLTDNSWIEKARRDGPSRAKEFSWQDCSRQTSLAIAELINQ